MSKRNQYTTSWCRIIDDVSKDEEGELSLPASVLDKFVKTICQRPHNSYISVYASTHQ